MRMIVVLHMTVSIAAAAPLLSILAQRTLCWVWSVQKVSVRPKDIIPDVAGLEPLPCPSHMQFHAQ